MDARVGLPLHSCARVCLCVIAGAGLCVLQAPGPEYKKLDTDLNKGSAGHFVYLCYKKGCAKKPSSPPRTATVLVYLSPPLSFVLHTSVLTVLGLAYTTQ